MKVDDLNRWLPVMAAQYTKFRHTPKGVAIPGWDSTLESEYSLSRSKGVGLFDLTRESFFLLSENITWLSCVLTHLHYQPADEKLTQWKNGRTKTAGCPGILLHEGSFPRHCYVRSSLFPYPSSSGMSL